jgi:hypothetical protein
MFHRREERKEIFEATSRVKSNECICPFVLWTGRTKKTRKKEKNKKHVGYRREKDINRP